MFTARELVLGIHVGAAGEGKNLDGCEEKTPVINTVIIRCLIMTIIIKYVKTPG